MVREYLRAREGWMTEVQLWRSNRNLMMHHANTSRKVDKYMPEYVRENHRKVAEDYKKLALEDAHGLDSIFTPNLANLDIIIGAMESELGHPIQGPHDIYERERVLNIGRAVKKWKHERDFLRHEQGVLLRFTQDHQRLSQLRIS